MERHQGCWGTLESSKCVQWCTKHSWILEMLRYSIGSLHNFSWSLTLQLQTQPSTNLCLLSYSCMLVQILTSWYFYPISYPIPKFPQHHWTTINHQGSAWAMGSPLVVPSHSSKPSSALAAADCSAAFLPLHAAPANLPASLPATSANRADLGLKLGEVSIPTCLVSRWLW